MMRRRHRTVFRSFMLRHPLTRLRPFGTHATVRIGFFGPVEARAANCAPPHVRIDARVRRGTSHSNGGLEKNGARLAVA